MIAASDTALAVTSKESTIKVQPERFGEHETPAVSARDLYAALGLRKDFTDWFKAQTGRARLVEGRDWIYPQKVVNTSAGRPRVDYILSVDAAKHLAMMCGTNRGFEIREYFLRCERQYQAQMPSAASLLADPATLRKLLADFAEQTVDAKAELAELAPKAQFHDAVADATNCQTLQAVAKVLDIGPNLLFQALRSARVLLSDNTPYQAQMDAGRFRVIEGHYAGRDNVRQTYTRTMVTGKGLAFIQKLLAERLAA